MQYPLTHWHTHSLTHYQLPMGGLLSTGSFLLLPEPVRPGVVEMQYPLAHCHSPSVTIGSSCRWVGLLSTGSFLRVVSCYPNPCAELFSMQYSLSHWHARLLTHQLRSLTGTYRLQQLPTGGLLYRLGYPNPCARTHARTHARTTKRPIHM